MDIFMRGPISAREIGFFLATQNQTVKLFVVDRFALEAGVVDLFAVEG